MGHKAVLCGTPHRLQRVRTTSNFSVRSLAETTTWHQKLELDSGHYAASLDLNVRPVNGG